jgi:hypothetical protein
MSIRLMHLRWSLLFLLGTAGCTSWRTQQLAPQQVISERHPDRIRVTLTDSSTLVLQHPTVSGDSIIGVTSQTQVSVAPAQVARLQVRRPNGWKTFGLVYLVVGTIAGIGMATGVGYSW